MSKASIIVHDSMLRTNTAYCCSLKLYSTFAARSVTTLVKQS